MTEINPDGQRLVAVLAKSAEVEQNLSEAEWERLLALAKHHDVVPVAYARLKERDVVPPPPTAARLRQAYLVSAARNVRLFDELAKILGAFEAAGIQVVPFKGASLARTAYGDIALRPMADLDLWVRREHIEAARSAMESLGYAPPSEAGGDYAWQAALTGETQMSKEHAPLVELHWKIFPGEWVRHTARIDEDAIWQRALAREGTGPRGLSHEDAVIHNCIHLAVTHKMSDGGLRTLLDLDVARQAWAIDWRTVAERARAWRVSCATWVVLHALAELFGDPDNELPLADLAPSSLRQSLLKRLASTRELVEARQLSGGPKRFLLLLLLVDRPASAFKLVWRAVFRDRHWLQLRYDLPNAPLWRIWQLRLKHIVHFKVSGEI
ncbi:MAG: nucleotidyltransferase family protein [Acidobacteria bacterium]|nr:nucleotidyltransferase family protein [Acidobacteriota bacterium]